jgi:hypothetical protein
VRSSNIPRRGRAPTPRNYLTLFFQLQGPEARLCALTNPSSVALIRDPSQQALQKLQYHRQTVSDEFGTSPEGSSMGSSVRSPEASLGSSLLLSQCRFPTSPESRRIPNRSRRARGRCCPRGSHYCCFGCVSRSELFIRTSPSCLANLAGGWPDPERVTWIEI